MAQHRRAPLKIEISQAHPRPTMREQLAQLAPKRPIEIIGPELVKTRRLNLRPLATSDRNVFLDAIRGSRRELQRFMDLWRAGDTDSDVFDRQLELTRLTSGGSKAWRRAAFLSDGTLVGCFNLNRIEYGLESSAEAGWWVRTDLAKLGLGTEGVRAIIDYAIEDLPGGLCLSKVEAVVHPDNELSKRLATRVGMVHKPHEAAAVMLNGQWVPHVVFAKSPQVVGQT